MEGEHRAEVLRGERFRFGENWWRFLSVLNEERIATARSSLAGFLGVTRLDGRRFLDAGSGSGLFSLAARGLGADVVSFDYDPRSVACTRELKSRYHADDAGWRIGEGSVLDGEYLASLGRFEIVYSWGVLHHTGAMWQAIGNLADLVEPGGAFFIALYNDQGWVSGYWRRVKRCYASGAFGSFAVIAFHVPYLIGARVVARGLTGRLKLERGMSLWHDMIDWLGGYPFEVARPEEVIQFMRGRGFGLQRQRTCGRRHGCNEFVFVRDARAAVRNS